MESIEDSKVAYLLAYIISNDIKGRFKFNPYNNKELVNIETRVQKLLDSLNLDGIEYKIREAYYERDGYTDELMMDISEVQMKTGINTLFKLRIDYQDTEVSAEEVETNEVTAPADIQRLTVGEFIRYINTAKQMQEILGCNTK